MRQRMNGTTGEARPPIREDLPDPAAFLEEAEIPFARDGDEAALVTTFHLRAGPAMIALLMMPKGLRADFRALARHLGTGHLSLGRRGETLPFGQLPSNVSPFGLRYDGAHRVRTALDERLLAHEQLGFPGKPGMAPIWLSHSALIVFLRSFGYLTAIGDWAAK
jgi:hypothetical protein